MSRPPLRRTPFIESRYNDDPKMSTAIETLKNKGIYFERPTEHQLKIDEINFYPAKGTIFIDGDPKRLAERGLEALLTLVRQAQPLNRLELKLEDPHL